MAHARVKAAPRRRQAGNVAAKKSPSAIGNRGTNIVTFEQIKTRYWTSLQGVEPSEIVPTGPEFLL